MTNKQNETVFISIMSRGAHWELITTRNQINIFVDEWKEGDPIILELTGIIDHRDKNEICIRILSEEIVSVCIHEITSKE